MAYTATVTKQSVTKVNDNIFNCTIKIVVNDGVNDIFESTASQQYNTNTTDMDAVKASLQQKLVADWDKYASEQNIFNKAAFDTLVGEIQTAANTYINQ